MISARRLAHAADTADAASPPRHGATPLRRPAVSKNLATIGLTALALLSFTIATGQFLGGVHGLDRTLLFGLPDPYSSEPPAGPKRLSELAWGFTALGSPKLVAAATAVVAGGLMMARRRQAALLLAIMVGGGAVFALLLKRFFDWLRPHHAPGEAADIILNTSFPSGHTLLATLLAFGLASVVARTAPEQRALKVYVFCVAATVSFAVGASRVYLGVHWPSDVIAGWTVGAAWVWLCHRASLRLLPYVQPSVSAATAR